MTREGVLESIERVAVHHRLPIIGPKRGKILDEVVVEHHPGTILEVGTLVGYSAVRMGRHLEAGQRITCVGIRRDFAETANTNFGKAGL